MKIVYIANARIPTEKAHGYQICKMCEEFADQGMEVELIIPSRSNSIKEDAFIYYELKRNFDIRVIKIFDFQNYKFLQRSASYLNSFFYFWHLFFLKIEKIVYVYTRNPEIAFLFFLRGYKTAYEDHGWPKSKIWLYKKLVSKLPKIITITEGIKNLYINTPSSTKRNILVAPDGVDLGKFNISITKVDARKKLNLPQNKKIIAYTGSFYLYRWKGIDVLIVAAEYFNNDYIFLLVGAKDEEIEEINKIIAGKKNIILLPQQPRNLIPFYLKAADILILPNKAGDKISEIYTSPLKLFEYMAAGRPIIASNLPSIREVLNGSNALLFEPNSPFDLVDKIKLIFSQQQYAESLAQQAFYDIKQYTWNERAKKIIKYLNA